MMSSKYEIKLRGRLGPEPGDQKSIRILNRVIEWTNLGLCYEADQRHAEIILRELGLSGQSKPVSTPSVPTEKPNDEELPPEKAKQYRGLVARANYLAQDRADIGFAVKELCRKMAKPTVSDWEALERLGRYLLGAIRVGMKFGLPK